MELRLKPYYKYFCHKLNYRNINFHMTGESTIYLLLYKINQKHFQMFHRIPSGIFQMA